LVPHESHGHLADLLLETLVLGFHRSVAIERADVDEGFGSHFLGRRDPIGSPYVFVAAAGLGQRGLEVRTERSSVRGEVSTASLT
jgi:hypothetical protein